MRLDLDLKVWGDEREVWSLVSFGRVFRREGEMDWWVDGWRLREIESGGFSKTEREREGGVVVLQWVAQNDDCAIFKCQVSSLSGPLQIHSRENETLKRLFTGYVEFEDTLSAYKTDISLVMKYSLFISRGFSTMMGLELLVEARRADRR